MAEVLKRQGGDEGPGAIAEEIPYKNLPPLEYRPMPDPLPLRQVLGPSVILLATSIGSGEFVLWPYISSQVGLVALWMAVIGVTLQFFINMEIERYTLATGETAVTGFTRLWKPWGPLFLLMCIIPWAWPGWATGSATALTFVFNLQEGAVTPITIALLLAIGAALTLSPVVYNAVERLEFVLVGIILVFLVVAVVIAINAQDWVDLVTGFSNVGRLPAGIELPVLLGALAFAGAGGTVNLAQSNWLRDKGMGMGTYIPKIVSPMTGEEISVPSIGYFFRQDQENLRRWQGWWKVANAEQFWTFLVIGGSTIIILSVLTHSTVGGQPVGEGFDFIRAEGNALSSLVGPWFGITFWLAGAFVLVSTHIGVLDHIGRVVADILKVGALRDSERWSESRIYFVIVWLEVLFGCGVLLAGATQPLTLLVLSAALNGLVMFIYCGLLLWLNGRVLPSTIALRGYRLVVMGIAFLFFGYFSVITLADQLPLLFGGE